jgi:hypothetical protein
VHRRIGSIDCYFVANVSGGARHVRARCAVGHRAPQRWDAGSGAIQNGVAYEYTLDRRGERVTDVELRLAPFESRFVVFGASTEAPAVLQTDARGDWLLKRDGRRVEVDGLVPAAGEYTLQLATGRTRQIGVGTVPPAIALDGPWHLAIGQRASVTLDRLRPWGELEEGQGYSGWSVYDIEFELLDHGEDRVWFIDLGAVHETAEVTLNGRGLGAAWRGLRRITCGDALVSGRNRLRVEVANLWVHHVLAHPPGDPRRRLKGVGPDKDVEETVGIRWGTYGEVPPEKVPPSGLLGPVRLVPMKRVHARL